MARGTSITSRATRMAAWVLSAPLIASCAGSGEGLDASGRPVGETPPGAGGTGVYREIQDTVFSPVCVQCHQGGAAPLGLRLDQANSYALLVGVPSVQVPSLLRVQPGDPDRSYLVRKIEGTASTGGRMPLGGPPLPRDRIDLIRGWIAAGAQPDSAGGASGPLQVASSIPAQGEKIATGPASITLIFDRGVDAPLAGAGTIELSAARPGSATASGLAEWQPVRMASVVVSAANPAVVHVATSEVLQAGRYRLRVEGDDVPALAGSDGSRLDGDHDGSPGGDFVLHFEVAARGLGR